MHTPYSLQKRLMLYISLFSMLLGCVLIFAAYRIALEEINEILDAQMQSLAERVAATQPRAQQSLLDPNKRYKEQDLFVDVWRYTSLNQPNHPQQIVMYKVDQAGFYRHETPSGLWLTYILPTQTLQIQISQQHSVRQALALELAANMFVPYFLFLPFALWALSWVIRKNFQPLHDFKTELANRKPQALTPIHMEHYPLELAPTIEEMNLLFQRIVVAQQEQRQFVADAAHELRTPLTALNLQVQILLQQPPQQAALEHLYQGVQRMQHLVNQLLELAKQDASESLIEQLQQISLNEMTLNCIEQLIQLALHKDLDLGVEQSQDIYIQGYSSAVHSIIYNILDNAIKYSPRYGVINVDLSQDEQYAILSIEDSGVGLAPEQFAHIRKRFYRVQQHAEIGSGLGLSIVDRAAQRLGASIEFSKSSQLGGLCVQVKFPLNPSVFKAL